MAISSAINDFVSSIYELFASVLSGIYNIFHTVFAAVFGLFSGVINLFADVFKGAIDVVGGLGTFLASKLLWPISPAPPAPPASPDIRSPLPYLWGALACVAKVQSADSRPYSTGNIVIVAIIAAGGYAFMRYNQGRPIAPAAQKKVQ
jgi:hypothetical protein